MVARWDDPVYTWDDPNVTWDGTILGETVSAPGLSLVAVAPSLQIGNDRIIPAPAAVATLSMDAPTLAVSATLDVSAPAVSLVPGSPVFSISASPVVVAPALGFQMAVPTPIGDVLDVTSAWGGGPWGQLPWGQTVEIIPTGDPLDISYRRVTYGRRIFRGATFVKFLSRKGSP